MISDQVINAHIVVCHVKLYQVVLKELRMYVTLLMQSRAINLCVERLRTMKRILLLCSAAMIVFSSCNTTNQLSSSEADLSTSSSNASSSVQQDTKKPVGIKGSHIIDITLGLKQNGDIPEPEMNESKDKSVSSHYCASKRYDDSLGITFDYNLSADTDFALISATFSATSDLLVDEDIFLELSKSYLGFCSTFPCDALSGTMSGTARSWLEYQIDNRDDIESGSSVVFDDVQFSVYWAKNSDQINSVWLNVHKYLGESDDGEVALPNTSDGMYHYTNKP